MDKVTVVVTSCGRFDLLQETLFSFFQYNTYPIHQLIITEDSGNAVPDFIYTYHPNTVVINPPQKEGQIKSIDRSYSIVTTEFIFHLEDDWCFYREGFIEESLAILNAEPNCSMVWLRERNDTNGHPVRHDKLVMDYKKRWHGFTFNPALRRRSHYERVMPYGKHTTFNSLHPWESEIKIGELYKRMNLYAKISKQGYVKHIGDGRHVTQQI
jgi:hypothetical protein